MRHMKGTTLTEEEYEFLERVYLGTNQAQSSLTERATLNCLLAIINKLEDKIEAQITEVLARYTANELLARVDIATESMNVIQRKLIYAAKIAAVQLGERSAGLALYETIREAEDSHE